MGFSFLFRCAVGRYIISASESKRYKPKFTVSIFIGQQYITN